MTREYPSEYEADALGRPAYAGWMEHLPPERPRLPRISRDGRRWSAQRRFGHSRREADRRARWWRMVVDTAIAELVRTAKDAGVEVNPSLCYARVPPDWRGPLPTGGGCRNRAWGPAILSRAIVMAHTTGESPTPADIKAAERRAMMVQARLAEATAGVEIERLRAKLDRVRAIQRRGSMSGLLKGGKEVIADLIADAATHAELDGDYAHVVKLWTMVGSLGGVVMDATNRGALIDPRSMGDEAAAFADIIGRIEGAEALTSAAETIEDAIVDGEAEDVTNGHAGTNGKGPQE